MLYFEFGDIVGIGRMLDRMNAFVKKEIKILVFFYFLNFKVSGFFFLFRIEILLLYILFYFVV